MLINLLNSSFEYGSKEPGLNVPDKFPSLNKKVTDTLPIYSYGNFDTLYPSFSKCSPIVRDYVNTTLIVSPGFNLGLKYSKLLSVDAKTSTP